MIFKNGRILIRSLVSGWLPLGGRAAITEDQLAATITHDPNATNSLRFSNIAIIFALSRMGLYSTHERPEAISCPDSL